MTKPFEKIFCGCVILSLVMALIPIKAEEVEVFAAASLTDALKEIAVGYEKESGDKIIFNFAASSVLETQIKAGAPADIFFSADEAKMNDLARQNLVTADTRKDLLSNSLVVVVPGDSTLTLTSAAQLADPKVQKIALGQTQSVPAGIYAKEYLTKIGIWDKVEARVIPMESVRAALAAVETGNADAGIVYKTDALHSKKVKIAYEVPIADGPVIEYPAALVQDSKHAVAAKKFLDYLGNASSLKTFEKYGFIARG
jgi:molybdate transport system substrate-binding protein